MATGIGPDDCATGITNQFTGETERIYIVACTVDVQAGTVIGSQWRLDDIELARFDFVPDFVIEDACVWFFADQTDFPFTPGAYTVQLTLNGVPAAPPIPFTISQN